MLRVLQGRLHRNSLLLEQADCTYEKTVLNRYEIAETLNSIAGSLGRARSFLVSRTMCTDTDRWDCSIGALIITHRSSFGQGRRTPKPPLASQCRSDWLYIARRKIPSKQKTPQPETRRFRMRVRDVLFMGTTWYRLSTLPRSHGCVLGSLGGAKLQGYVGSCQKDDPLRCEPRILLVVSPEPTSCCALKTTSCDTVESKPKYVLAIR